MEDYTFVDNSVVITNDVERTSIVVVLTHVDGMAGEEIPAWKVWAWKDGEEVFVNLRYTLQSAIRDAKDALQAGADHGTS
mgnify:CR=1 FL=1